MGYESSVKHPAPLQAYAVGICANENMMNAVISNIVIR